MCIEARERLRCAISRGMLVRAMQKRSEFSTAQCLMSRVVIPRQGKGEGRYEMSAGGSQKKTAATEAACVLIVVCEPDPLVRTGLVEGAAL